MSLSKILAFVALGCALVALLGIPSTVFLVPIAIGCLATAILIGPNPS